MDQGIRNEFNPQRTAVSGKLGVVSISHCSITSLDGRRPMMKLVMLSKLGRSPDSELVSLGDARPRSLADATAC